MMTAFKVYVINWERGFVLERNSGMLYASSLFYVNCWYYHFNCCGLQHAIN